MKLSEKGLKRLLDVAFDGDEFYQSNALQIEFEPDDFDGGCFQNGKDHVTLTVEEAKGLLEIARDYRMHLFAHCRIPLSLSSNEAFTALRERIEQVEATNTQDELIRIKCEIAQLKAEQELDAWLKQQFLKRMED